MILGICGGSGSGKSLVCSILSDLGYPVIDADKIYHTLISTESECVRAIFLRFGAAVFDKDGRVDRKALGSLVFKDPIALADLNKITHEHVLNEMDKQILAFKANGHKNIVCDVPLLFESGFDKKCDYTIAVIADYSLRIKRITLRDKISPESAALRISKQISDSELIRKCDFVIDNNASVEKLKGKIDFIINKIGMK